MDSIEKMTQAREALREAFDNYEAVLEEAAIDHKISAVERKSAEISCTELICARRVVCMD